MELASTNDIRALTDDELARLEKTLGQPIERAYLAHWVLRAIQAFTWFLTLASPGERRDDLKEIAEQGRKWIEAVGLSRSARLLPPAVDLEHLMRSARTFCAAAASAARALDQAVGPGHPRSNFALEALLEPFIGIAKRAKVLPSTPNRFMLSLRSSPRPPFFEFVTEGLEIAMEVIRTSPLPQDHKDAALAVLSKVTDPALVKILERIRGRISDYREGTIGLVESDISEADGTGPPGDPSAE